MVTNRPSANDRASNEATRQGCTTTERRAPGGPFATAFTALEKLADGEDIPLAVIGGVAAAHHGYPRSTQAIDVAVAAPDLARLLRECHRYDGLHVDRIERTGECVLDYHGTCIKVWQEGMFAEDIDAPEALPHPAELGVTEGLGFATLPAWVRLKLARGQSEDQADIVEIIKTKGSAEVRAIEVYLARLPPAYLERFQHLHALARREQQRQSDAVRNVQR